MKIATTTGDFSPYVQSQEEAIQYLSQAGFKYLDYSACMDYEKRNGIYSADWKQHIERVKKLTESLCVEFVQSHAPMGRPIEKGEYHTKFVNDTKRSIECSAMLGIKNVVVHTGYEAGISKEENFERNKDFFQELLLCAEEYDVNILVENFNRMYCEGIYWIDSAPDLREMVDYVNHPLFHACWDVGHGNMQQMSQDESLRILGEHVYALHVQDNSGNEDSHVPPFFGTVNLDSLMHGLKEIGYKGYFTFEACCFFGNPCRRTFEKDSRLLQVPLELRIKAENLLYEIGKTILSSYNCFEE